MRILELEKVKLEELCSHFNSLVKDGNEIETRIREMHKKYGLLMFDHLHFMYHSAKSLKDNNKNIEIKGYILFKLDVLDDYFKSEHELWLGGHNLPTLLHILTLLNEDIQKKDNYTARHAERVSEISIKIGKKLDLDNEDMFKLEVSAILHDIGKIDIADVILNKTEKYTPEESQIMMHHPIYGAERVRTLPLKERILNEVIDTVRAHHEWLDGSGYPSGLTDGNIPPLAKIIAVADSFDAMTSDRIYKPHLTIEEAKKELIICSGVSSYQFDRKIVESFLS